MGVQRFLEAVQVVEVDPKVVLLGNPVRESYPMSRFLAIFSSGNVVP